MLLPVGRANIENCAETVGVAVRTLQRNLDSEGTSFSAQLNKVRVTLSGRMLANRRVRITDIADILGYGSIGSFTRWHIQNFGMPPRDRRKATQLPMS